MKTTIELFAGIGGFSSEHTRPLAFVEKEPSCRAILRRHYPDALILDDVRTVGAHNLPWTNAIKFGFPCQDLSVAGNRAGLTGARSGLFYEATRIVHELQPDFAIWENVPGLLSSGAGRDFLAVLTELDRIGFAGGWTTVDAQFFGVAQRRQRVFGVFARRDIGAARCAEILSFAARLPWNTQTGAKKRENTTARAGTSFKRRGGFGWSESQGVTATLESEGGTHQGGPERVPLTIAHTLTANYGKQIDSSDTNNGPPNLIYQEAQYGVAEYNSAGSLRAGRIPEHQMVLAAPAIAVSVAENQRGELRTSDIAAQLTHGGGKPGQGYSAVLAFTERTRAEGRTLEAQDDLAYALCNPGSGGRTHSRQIAGGFGVRRLTPRECERLQGFPDDYTAWGIDEQGGRVEMSDSVRYRMLGNAICRKVSAWIDSQIVRYANA